MGRLLRRAGPYLVLGLGLALVLLLGRQAALRPIGQATAGDATQEVGGSTTVGQTFVASFDGLHQIDVRLGSGDRAGAQALTLHLRAAPDASEAIRSATLSVAPPASDGWASFEFEPVPDSGGQSLYFSLESPAASSGTRPTVDRALGDRYRDGSYFLNGAPAEGDLTFRIHSRPSLVAWFLGLVRLLAQAKPSFLADPACYGLLLLVYLMLLAAVMHRLVPGTE